MYGDLQRKLRVLRKTIVWEGISGHKQYTALFFRVWGLCVLSLDSIAAKKNAFLCPFPKGDSHRVQNADWLLSQNTYCFIWLWGMTTRAASLCLACTHRSVLIISWVYIGFLCLGPSKMPFSLKKIMKKVCGIYSVILFRWLQYSTAFFIKQ